MSLTGERGSVILRAIAAGAFGVVAVLAAFLLTHAGDDWFTSAQAISVAGTSFGVARGRGEHAGAMLVLSGAADGTAVATAPVPPFAAGDYPRVNIDVHARSEPDQVAFVFRTRENPNRTFTIPLRWAAGGATPLHAAAHESWRGTIVGIGVAVRSTFTAPVELNGVRMQPGSVSATLGELVGQWRTYFPLRGYAVAFPFDAERAAWLPLVLALALASLVGLAAYAVLCRVQHRGFDWRVAWLVVAAAWLVLDVRWIANLVNAVEETRARFAGKSMEQKWLASDDAPLYELARDARTQLPPPPARVLVLSDRPLLAVRIAHFLAPYNVYAPLRLSPSRDEGRRRAPEPAVLQSGDYVLMFLYRGLQFDGAARALLWPDGQRRAAVPLVVRPGALLVRVQ